MKKLIPLTFATALILGSALSPASASAHSDEDQARDISYSYHQDYSYDDSSYIEHKDESNAHRWYQNSAPEVNQAPQNTTPNNAPTQPVSNASKADAIVNYALSLVGKARYGHTNPSALTFDCSGFTYYVFKKYGVDLQSRSPQGQVKDGVSISKSQLQKGDLVFFSNSHKSLGHVGIYIGNNKIVHAANSQSDITISDLNGSWYQQHYVTARHVL